MINQVLKKLFLSLGKMLFFYFFQKKLILYDFFDIYGISLVKSRYIMTFCHNDIYRLQYAFIFKYAANPAVAIASDSVNQTPYWHI